MIFLERPGKFNPRFEIVSCFLEHDGKILVLHRQDHKPQGGTWSVPAGKVEKGESLAEALRREVLEELGIELAIEDEHHVKTVFVKHHGYSFPYHMFKLVLDSKPEIVLNREEHKDFDWVRPANALELELIEDEDVCIRMIYFARE